MIEQTSQLESPPMTDLELGKILGQRKAFGLVAGRCSAAQVAAMKQIRDEKAYLSQALTWEEFCDKELRVSRVHANRMIKWLEEFGPAYFELAQLTTISPEEYRELAPVIVDHQIQVNGQVIALVPEKAEELADVVADLRRQAALNRAPVTSADRLKSLERQFDKLTTELEQLCLQTPADDRAAVSAVLSTTIRKLTSLDQSM